jgi:hypothetical protein
VIQVPLEIDVLGADHEHERPGLLGLVVGLRARVVQNEHGGRRALNDAALQVHIGRPLWCRGVLLRGHGCNGKDQADN